MMVPTSTMDPEVQLRLPLDVPAEQDLLNQPVFPLIHAIKKDVERIDASLSWDQLNAVDVNYSIFRPLVFKYAKLRNYAIVIESASQDLAFAPLKLTRADACELLALKLLRRFTGNSDNPVDLFSVLTVSWDPLQGCPDSCMSDIREITGEDIRNADRVSALEIAISSEAKRFIASPLVQTCITDIYNGRVVFSAPATRGSILADNYKQRHVQVYDVHNTPWLDHYSLMQAHNLSSPDKSFSTMNWSEIVFIIFAFGFLLDELTAALEHGWDSTFTTDPLYTFTNLYHQVYIQNMWNGFDLAFATIFIVYLGCRCRGLVKDDFWWNDLAYDILACGACILFPRLAFFAIKNNLIILALQVLSPALTRKCNMEFAQDCMAHDPGRFGNTFLSFTVAESFHPIFGPILMHASEEYLYQFAISTIEGQRIFDPNHAAGSSMFDSVSRQFRLFESFMGTSRDDVMGAIFEIDVPPSVTNAFSTEDDREPGMEDSAEFGKAQEPDETRQGRPEIVLSPTPRRSRSRTSRTYREEQPPNSPLARLFGTVRQRAISAQGDALGDIRKIGEAMENLKEAAMPGDKLRQEIKELSERQARIETLLLTLTRGMRGEGNGSSSSQIRLNYLKSGWDAYARAVTRVTFQIAFRYRVPLFPSLWLCACAFPSLYDSSSSLSLLSQLFLLFRVAGRYPDFSAHGRRLIHIFQLGVDTSSVRNHITVRCR
ncbi:hypothetical protein AG1IA_05835 [Rhizoctonia solani AG-1 IA]|uniref:Calcium channel YVC1 n=1 Tax=Thanatephorus cucumeris (strain AG1-IA) TaxID=983506 RepID=L8WTL6_THACA|nr:hypothetical protein AG1IA_05835 [Rhizoctonia solani AG-1 IA]